MADSWLHLAEARDLRGLEAIKIFWGKSKMCLFPSIVGGAMNWFFNWGTAK